MKVITRSRDEVFQLWMKALRSGEYKQGFGQLHKPKLNSFCCLGVVCDLAVQDGGKPWSTRALKAIHPAQAFPPDNISQFLFGPNWYEICDFIAEVNDNNGKNFNQMADLIERIKTDLDKGIEFNRYNYYK